MLCLNVITVVIMVSDYRGGQDFQEKKADVEDQ